MPARALCRLKTIPRQVCSFCTTTNSNESRANYNKINSWQIHSYGNLEEVQFSRTRPPIIRDPNSVVVKVLSASVNPLDIAMISKLFSHLHLHYCNNSNIDCLVS